KSSVARMLAALGAAVLDSDRMCHEEYGDPEVVATLKAWWGDRICRPDGQVQRAAIAEIVFGDPSELAKLEGLLYPRLARRRDELVAQYEADPEVKAIVLDAPKLFEAGLEGYCDSIIFVDCDWSTRVARVASARGWTAEELLRRENLLNPLDSKKTIADHVVVNHSTLVSLRAEVERVFSSVLATFTE
ncbi:MAG: dephospho-CoA kinase, partial [Planctomycetes bacterium]|nr:dephospho-CoA kinase [Planctomycetota bacterium]